MALSEGLLFALAFWGLLAATVVYTVHLLTQRRWTNWLATGLALAVLLSQAGGLAARGLRAARWPLADVYEFALAFVAATVLAWLLLERWTRTRAGGAFALGIALLLDCYPILRVPAARRVTRPLVPALRSPWLPLHVGMAVLAYGAFAVAAGAALLVLVRWAVERRRERLMLPAVSPETGVWPDADVCDNALYRAVVLGYPWMTLALLCGAIWAQMAWGRYWNWDIKETWSLIIWLIYTLFLHLRLMRGWRGPRLALVALAGFGTVLFTLWGVSWLARTVGLQSLHVY